jgi:hypothetical protein
MGAVAFLLIVISVGGQLIKYVAGHDYVYGLLPLTNTLFNVDREQNITTLFSVFLLLCSAVLLAVIALIKRQEQDPELSRWAILTCGFLSLAIDEAWSFHEMLIEPVRGLLGHDNLGIFFFAWVIPAMAGVLILALFFLGFLLRLPSTTRLSFVGAGFLYLGGAVGVEMIGGRYAEVHGLENLTYQLIAHAEESLEMAGTIVFIYALLRYLAEQYPEVQFLIDDSQQQDRDANHSLVSRENAAP